MAKKDSRKNKLTIISPAMDKKTSIRKRVEALSKGDWTIPQEFLQEIQATDIAESITAESEGKQPKATNLKDQTKQLKKLIEEKYKEEPEIKQLLLDSLPGYNAIRLWTLKDGWQEAIMAKIRLSYAFSEERRTRVLNAVYNKAVEKGDMKAAELYLKISGDLDTGKNGKGSKEADDYSAFNQILRSKKK